MAGQFFLALVVLVVRRALLRQARPSIGPVRHHLIGGLAVE